MKARYLITICIFVSIPLSSYSQRIDTLNRTDDSGKKQGYWIKKYPSGKIQYEGYFRDNHPAGIFKRYYDNDTLQSILFYNSNGKEAEAIFFHRNGFIAAAGKYVDQKKEGKWQFFSSLIKGYMVSEEEYSNNMRNGMSVKFFPDKTISEKTHYINNLKDGEWTQYHSNGKLFTKANYSNGILEGSFEVWDASGRQTHKGQYKNDRRDGIWYIYNPDGSVKSEIKYSGGVALNPEYYLKENAWLDSLEQAGKKVSDPEKTGSIW